MQTASFFNHRPTTLEEIRGQDGAITQLKRFFANFKKGKGLFLYGPTGTGKTASVYAFAQENDYEVLELNASDARNQKSIEEFMSKATGQMSLFSQKKLILIDEVDGLSGKYDRGAAKAIADYIERSIFPIVITGHDLFDSKLKPLKKVVVAVEYTPVVASAAASALDLIGKQYGCALSPEKTKAIARGAAGDMRAAVTDYFIACLEQTSDLVLEARKQTPTLTSALTRVFKSTQVDIAFGAYDDVDEDLDTIFLWVDQNITKEYTKMQDVSKAFETLAQADIFFGRIRRWQYYRFYVYCYTLLSVGIALSKDEKYSSAPNYSQPSRLLKYWQANMSYAKRKSIIEKLSAHTKTSQKIALQDIYPYLLSSLVKNKSLQQELDLDAEEIAWLKKQVA